MISRTVFVCIGCFVITGFFALVKTVRANDYWFGQVQSSRAAEPCDPFTPDVDELDESASCMRFGGRVRVELGARPSERAHGAAPAAVRVESGNAPGGGALDLPLRVESGVSRSHLRLPNGSSSGTIDPYTQR